MRYRDQGKCYGKLGVGAMGLGVGEVRIRGKDLSQRTRRSDAEGTEKQREKKREEKRRKRD